MNELHLRYKRETGNSPLPVSLDAYPNPIDDEHLEPDLIVCDFGTDPEILLELKSNHTIEIPNKEYIEWLESQIK